MSPEFLEAYEQIERKNLTKVQGFIESSNVFAFLNGVRRAMNVADLDVSPKLDWVMTLLSGSRSKTVVFSAWKKSGQELLVGRCEGHGIPFVCVTGDHSIRARKKAVETFNEDPTCEVLIITQAGAEGLDLKGARRVIALDGVWNAATLTQIFGRAARFLSHAHLPPEERELKTFALYMDKPFARKGRPSADRMMLEIVQKKRAILRAEQERLQLIQI